MYQAQVKKYLSGRGVYPISNMAQTFDNISIHLAPNDYYVTCWKQKFPLITEVLV